MMREKILEIIQEVLNTSVSEEDELIELNIDSIIMISLLIELEKEFNFVVDEEILDYRKYSTVSDIIDMVEKLHNQE